MPTYSHKSSPGRPMWEEIVEGSLLQFFCFGFRVGLWLGFFFCDQPFKDCCLHNSDLQFSDISLKRTTKRNPLKKGD